MIKQFTLNDIVEMNEGREPYNSEEKELNRIIEMFGLENISFETIKETKRRVFNPLKVNYKKGMWIRTNKHKIYRVIGTFEKKLYQRGGTHLLNQYVCFEIQSSFIRNGHHFNETNPVYKNCMIKAENIVMAGECEADCLEKDDVILFKNDWGLITNGKVKDKFLDRIIIEQPYMDNIRTIIDSKQVVKVYAKEQFQREENGGDNNEIK